MLFAHPELALVTLKAQYLLPTGAKSPVILAALLSGEVLAVPRNDYYAQIRLIVQSY